MKSLILPGFVLLMLSCSGDSGQTARKDGQAEKKTGAKTVKKTSLLSPGNSFRLALGEDIPLKLEYPDSVKVDSAQVFLGGRHLHTLVAGLAFPAQGPLEARIPTAGMKCGRSALRIRIFFPGEVPENQSRQITILADEPPVEYRYSLVREYPHDRAAYTQGLEFVDGFLYEGTGDYGTSFLRKLRLETGEVLKQRDLEQRLFGEGITVLGERIYQITYRSQVGFVYDRESFEEVNKVYYQNKEGWGLSNNGKELIMSDGSHVIYFLDPELFTVNRQIEVYTDKGPAESLNELEYIDGRIWANRYYTDEIVIIDPQSGKVEGRVLLKGLLKTADRRADTDVLNGIAWDEEGKRLFVTGKRWPKLFEIRVEVRGGA